MHFSPLDIIAALPFLVALFGWINLRALRLPTTVGLMAIAIVVSLVVAVAGQFAPGVWLGGVLGALIHEINFSHAVLYFLLSFGSRGISIALALRLPQGPERSLILSCAYFVVLFSTFVQSLTMPWVLKRLCKA